MILAVLLVENRVRRKPRASGDDPVIPFVSKREIM